MIHDKRDMPLTANRDAKQYSTSMDSINITAGALPGAVIIDGSINSRPGSPRGCIAGSDGGSVQRCDLMP